MCHYRANYDAGASVRILRSLRDNCRELSSIDGQPAEREKERARERRKERCGCEREPRYVGFSKRESRGDFGKSEENARSRKCSVPLSLSLSLFLSLSLSLCVLNAKQKQKQSVTSRKGDARGWKRIIALYTTLS